jgi:hypothetical protein
VRVLVFDLLAKRVKLLEKPAEKRAFFVGWSFGFFVDLGKWGFGSRPELEGYIGFSDQGQNLWSI